MTNDSCARRCSYWTAKATGREPCGPIKSSKQFSDASTDLEPSPATRTLRDSIVRRTRHVANHVQDTTPGRTAPPDIPPPRAGCLPHVEARRLYTEGRFFWSKRSQTALERAVECFTQATSHVRTFAQAYAGLADAYQSLAAYGYLPHSQALPKATAAAECALALDDSLVDAHTSLAGVMALAGDAAGADDRYRRALRSNPTYVPALHLYATFLRQHGQTEAAYKYSRRAMALDPLWAVVTFTVGTILRGQREYDKAIELCCRATELDPSYAPAWYFLACTYAQVGRADHAVKCATRSVTLGGETSLLLGWIKVRAGRTGQPQAALRTLDALGQTDAHGAECSDRALVYVGLGETDCAVECLERPCFGPSCSTRTFDRPDLRPASLQHPLSTAGYKTPSDARTLTPVFPHFTANSRVFEILVPIDSSTDLERLSHSHPGSTL